MELEEYTVYVEELEKTDSLAKIRTSASSNGTFLKVFPLDANLGCELPFLEAFIARMFPNHPNITKCNRVFLSQKRIIDGVERQALCMELEKADCDLREYLVKNSALKNEEKHQIARDICSGLAALHEKGIYHGDLKPSNILMVGKRAKLSDFGNSHFVEAGTSFAMYTQGYQAPEIFMNIIASKTGWSIPNYDERITDMWALGITLAELYGLPLPEFPSIKDSEKALEICRNLFCVMRPPDFYEPIWALIQPYSQRPNIVEFCRMFEPTRNLKLDPVDMTSLKAKLPIKPNPERTERLLEFQRKNDMYWKEPASPFVNFLTRVASSLSKDSMFDLPVTAIVFSTFSHDYFAEHGCSANSFHISETRMTVLLLLYALELVNSDFASTGMISFKSLK